MVLKYTYMLAVYSTTNHDIFYQPRRLFVVRDRTSSSSIHICVTALVVYVSLLSIYCWRRSTTPSALYTVFKVVLVARSTEPIAILEV